MKRLCAQTFIECLMGVAAVSCSGDPPSGVVKCNRVSDCPSELAYCRSDDEFTGAYCYDTPRDPGDDPPDTFCDALIEELGFDRVEHCNGFEASLDEPANMSEFFCNYANEPECPVDQPMREREGSTNKVFESRLGPGVGKSEVGCGSDMFQRYDIRFEYLGPKVEGPAKSTFAKLWILTPVGDDFAQVRLRRTPDGANLEVYGKDDGTVMESSIEFDASETMVRLRMRIDVAGSISIYVDDRLAPDAQVDLEFAGAISPHIGLEGSKVEQWGRFDNFAVTAAD